MKTESSNEMRDSKPGIFSCCLSSLNTLSLSTLLLLAAFASRAEGVQFVQATGGDITNTIMGIDGYFWKVHTFTNSGSFNVSVGGTGVEYLVVGGGGGFGDGNGYSGGGGAGGYRSSCSAPGELSGASNSPESALSVVVSSYTVTGSQVVTNSSAITVPYVK